AHILIGDPVSTAAGLALAQRPPRQLAMAECFWLSVSYRLRPLVVTGLASPPATNLAILDGSACSRQETGCPGQRCSHGLTRDGSSLPPMPCIGNKKGSSVNAYPTSAEGRKPYARRSKILCQLPGPMRLCYWLVDSDLRLPVLT